MFIDDERFPPNDGSEWVIVRSMDEFFQAIEDKDFPSFISFDHDLGENMPTGYDIAKWMVNADLDNGSRFIPFNFTFYVHSQNPIGKRNIERFLNQYLRFRD
jgi:hypothetical protein